jgi:hypothetical protein
VIPMHILHAAAQQETAKAAILKQLREQGSASATMPGSVDAGTDDAKAALSALIEAGAVHEARPGLFYLDETKAKPPRQGSGFVALLAILIIASITASLIALAATAG